MIRFIVRNLYASTIYREDDSPVRRAHAGLKLVAFAAVIAAGFATDNLLLLAALFSYPLAIGLTDDPAALVYSLKAPLVPAAMVGVLTALLSSAGPLSIEALVEGAELAMRLLLMASLLALYMATTHPQRLVALLSAAGMPLWLTEAVEIAWRLIPLTLRDTDEALVAMRLKG
ncbi:MAG: energy-coupling factor transporter transmembrane component T, partial [Candidatus Korarchaeota archaeon]|nr:energy-coupling factor transporter transmembrane component T [Candidatus Korarchaeota archaeon]